MVLNFAFQIRPKKSASCSISWSNRRRCVNVLRSSVPGQIKLEALVAARCHRNEIELPSLVQFQLLCSACGKQWFVDREKRSIW